MSASRQFDPDVQPDEATAAVSSPFAWTSATGRYRGVAFVGPGYDYTAVYRADQHGQWRLFARVDSDPASPIVAFDVWRMRRTGYVMSGEPYPAWTDAYGDVRDATGLPPEEEQEASSAGARSPVATLNDNNQVVCPGARPPE